MVKNDIKPKTNSTVQDAKQFEIKNKMEIPYTRERNEAPSLK